MMRPFLFAIFSAAALTAAAQTAPLPQLRELAEIQQREQAIEIASKALAARAAKLQKRLAQIPAADRSKAERTGSIVERLANGNTAGALADEFIEFNVCVVFRAPGDGDQYYAVGLCHDDGELEGTPHGEGNHVLIAPLGDVAIEKVDASGREFTALATYSPPASKGAVPTEFGAGGVRFVNRLAATPRTTYLVRAVSYALDSRLDAIYALRVERRDSDGSIVVFYRQLKAFPPPKLETDPIYTSADIDLAGIDAIVREELTKAGLPAVTLELVDDRTIAVKGEAGAPEAERILEIVKTVAELYRIENRLVLK